MKFSEITVTDKLKFQDISTEHFREYHFQNKCLRINSPIALNVSPSGGHRVIDCRGVSYYVRPGWDYIRWFGEHQFVL
jgi:hypothetical protein